MASLLRLLLAIGVLASTIGPADAGGRRLVAADVVRIKVVNQAELDTETRIEPGGTITFPYAGRLRAAGLSEDELADRLARALEKGGIVTKPQVLVSVVSFGAQVSVLGGVTTPGVLPLDRPTTLSQAIARAGGLSGGAGNTVVIRRPGRNGVEVLRYDAKAVVSGRTNEGNTYVQNNDEIYVDDVSVYYLYGFVNRAGQYPLTRKMTVQQALALGGGISELGSEWRIRIRRRLPTGEIAETGASLDDNVEPNDTVVVNERFF